MKVGSSSGRIQGCDWLKGLIEGGSKSFEGSKDFETIQEQKIKLDLS